jgi:hypothetical protein
MKLLKPNWVHHNGKKIFQFILIQLSFSYSISFIADNSIFSIDVHPDSSRFATGGQGKFFYLLH